MATTEYGVGHALAVQKWEKELLKESLKRTWISKFMGRSSDSLVYIHDTLKDYGYQTTYGLRMQLSGAGIVGDGTLEGNEEALTLYSDSIQINQLRHAVRTAGKASEQRVPFETRAEARDGLADWYADRFDTSFFNQLGGVTTLDTRYTGLNSVTATDSNHWIYANSEASEASLSDSSTWQFKITLLDEAIEAAKTLSPEIRPIRYMGDDYYVCFLHPYQVKDLRTDASANTVTWYDVQKSYLSGNAGMKSPIFTGALGVYNGVILHESTRVPVSPTKSTVRRAIFTGAQAACMAFGKGSGPNKFTWREELFDYGNQLGVSAGLIWGLKKSVFNSANFSSIVISTGAA